MPPTACSFYASYQQQCYEAVTPRQLASAEKPNVVTEACYGGKFQDYGRGETMLLAAMGDMTLLYLGSSRIAWVLRRAVRQPTWTMPTA